MICPSCDGKGLLVFPMAWEYMRRHGRPATAPCPDCMATGKVDDRHPQWRTAGLMLKDARICRRETLRDFCRRTGTDPTLRSAQERGFVDPSGAAQ